MRMPDGDTKAAWREQVTELQRALQMATTRMLSDTQQPPSRCMSSSSYGAEPSICCSYVVSGCAPTTRFQSITYTQTNVDDLPRSLPSTFAAEHAAGSDSSSREHAPVPDSGADRWQCRAH